jgi:Flp pilus assembly protein TadG
MRPSAIKPSGPGASCNIAGDGSWPWLVAFLLAHRFMEALCLGGREPNRDGNATGNWAGGPSLPAASRQRGSAVVEFTFLGLLLMVPVVYFIITIGQIQGGSFAVVGAADQAAKVFVAQRDEPSGRAAAEQAAILAMADHGHPAENARVDISCDPGDCMAAGSAVTVTVHLSVPLPFVPFSDAFRLNASQLNASATQIVGKFR